MRRTIVYRSSKTYPLPEVAAMEPFDDNYISNMTDDEKREYTAQLRQLDKTLKERIGGDTPDDYKDKLLKYVPAEVLAAFAGLSAAAGAKDSYVWLVLAAGLIGTPAYLWYHANRIPEQQHDEKPAWYFYVLATGAFIVWALATSDAVRRLLNISTTLAQILLGITVFLIPVVDAALTTLFGPND